MAHYENESKLGHVSLNLLTLICRKCGLLDFISFCFSRSKNLSGLDSSLGSTRLTPVQPLRVRKMRNDQYQHFKMTYDEVPHFRYNFDLPSVVTYLQVSEH